MTQNEQKKIIIIEGYLASGKSTFAVRLSQALNIPYFIKDTFKTAICAGLEITNREESKKYSAVVFDAIMYAAERLMENGYPMILEGNFTPAGIKKKDEAGAIRALIEEYGYRALTFKFFGNTRVLHKRFLKRESTPERGQANKTFSEISFDDFDKICHNLDSFDVGGKVIKIDTTDFSPAGLDGGIESARLFMKNRLDTF